MAARLQELEANLEKKEEEVKDILLYCPNKHKMTLKPKNERKNLGIHWHFYMCNSCNSFLVKHDQWYFCVAHCNYDLCKNCVEKNLK